MTFRVHVWTNSSPLEQGRHWINLDDFLKTGIDNNCGFLPPPTVEPLNNGCEVPYMEVRSVFCYNIHHQLVYYMGVSAVSIKRDSTVVQHRAMKRLGFRTFLVLYDVKKLTITRKNSSPGCHKLRAQNSDTKWNQRFYYKWRWGDTKHLFGVHDTTQVTTILTQLSNKIQLS